MMWSVRQIQAMQDYALSHAWAMPEEVNMERAMLSTKTGWAVMLSVNR